MSFDSLPPLFPRKEDLYDPVVLFSLPNQNLGKKRKQPEGISFASTPPSVLAPLLSPPSLFFAQIAKESAHWEIGERETREKSAAQEARLIVKIAQDNLKEVEREAREKAEREAQEKAEREAQAAFEQELKKLARQAAAQEVRRRANVVEVPPSSSQS
jgi:hypothetical protein